MIRSSKADEFNIDNWPKDADIMDNIIILDKDNNIYIEDYGTGERLEIFGKAYLSDGERATYKRLCNGV